MGLQKTGSASGRSLSLRTSNKFRRQALHIQQKKAANKSRHEERHRRRKEEAKDPSLREARLAKNKSLTLEDKRVYDDNDDDHLGANVDLIQLRRQRLEEEEAEAAHDGELPSDDDAERGEDDDSMLGSDDEDDEQDDQDQMAEIRRRSQQRANSLAPSTTSTNMDLTPASLMRQFRSLFSDETPRTPKILVTTSLNSTLHREAQDLATLFPNSTYIPRSAHRYGHKYSVREIAKFGKNRGYTALVLIKEDQKQPTGLSIIHLNPESPPGPTLTFSVTNYAPGSRLPGHGNPTDHYPELLLNNFKTPLGLLVAKSFETLFTRPELEGRQVVTMHNQRDYIFVRRHRYVFREKKGAEKNVVAADGKEIEGVKGIRVGLQELGPRCTIKLRRVDKGVGRAGSEGEDALSWEWKPKMEKVRTRFNL